MGNMHAFPNPGYRFLRWEVVSGPIFIFSPNIPDLAVSQSEAGNSVIRAVFEPVQGGNVTVKHEDEEGNQLANPSVLTGLVDQTYTTEALSISGWQLSKTPENASGTFRVEEQTVVYTYEPEQNLWGTVPWSYEEGTETITLYGGEAGEVADAPWKTYSSVKQIIVEDQVILPENSERLFSNLRNLEIIENSDSLDVSNVENMMHMFSNASSLRELDLLNWDTSNVINMRGMFSLTTSLIELDLNNWNMSNVTDISSMFNGTSSLKTLHVCDWDTSNVIDMSTMFLNASSITELDLGSWNTSSLIRTLLMFKGASSLTRLDISNWDTASLIVILDMFANTSLKTIILGEKTDFSNLPLIGSINFPQIEITDEYTGRWILEESLISGTGVIAFENSTEFMTMYDGTHPGTYTWEVKNVNPVDPLDPETEVEPENKPEVPENQGRLSLDFVSQFNFGTQKISVSDQTYYAQPQRLLNENGTVDETAERPNYVQISDRRPANERNGWQLSVTQNGQFRNESEHELIGTEIQLFNQELVTVQGGASPKLQEEPVQRILPNTRKILLQAEGESGTGTWIYRFGDAETAKESVALNVPKGANPEATSYSTKLTWELSSVPDN
ncbi:WxL domain-containing protein [Serratia marcescens]|nr:WxL domain-containing protein [Serratia marcescens]